MGKAVMAAFCWIALTLFFAVNNVIFADWVYYLSLSMIISGVIAGGK